jgi:nucleotide-binding universal stress UspA family protein
MACTDFSPLADAAVATALEIGDVMGAQRVHVAHAIPNLPETRDLLRDEGSHAARLLEGLDMPLSRVPSVTREARYGDATNTLALLAGEVGADLIVVGSHGRGALGRMVLGSVAQALIRVAPSPVLVLHDRDRHPHRFENVLAAVDMTGISKRVLANAIAFAKPYGGTVRALSVFEGEYPLAYGVAWGRRVPQGTIEAKRRSALIHLVGGMATDGVQLMPHVAIHEDAFSGIRDFAIRERPDLIVIGTSGRNAFERMVLGATATHVLSWAKCAVLVVPYEGP